MYQMIIYHLVVIVNMMTIEELMNKLGLVEVSKVDKQLLEHLLHLDVYKRQIYKIITVK